MSQPTSIVDATRSFESWMSGLVDVVASELEYKHKQMSDPQDPFPFFRGSYYRWAQQFLALCPKLMNAPSVLAVGDLHIENFGNWRDREGRLCWGVNDYDEADELPFVNDLVRLAASVRFARWREGVSLKFKEVCAAILDGYRAAIKSSGEPFVLEERHPELRALALSADRDPSDFWKKLTKLLATEAVDPPPAAVAAIVGDLPHESLKPAFRRRPQVGMGSLGKPRFVAIVEWAGGWVAREAKAVTPPATSWTTGRPTASRAAEIVAKARHAPDPFYRPGSTWISRRLAPHCSRIELRHLTAVDDVTTLFHSMGAEAANVHLGSLTNAADILKFLDQQGAEWLPLSAKLMAEAVHDDWRAWRSSPVGV